MGDGRRGLFVLLVLGILLPAVILAVFGFRSLRQDRVIAERQTRDALDNALELASREITRELARWQEWQEPVAATFTFTRDGRLQSAHGLLWLPGAIPEPALPEEAYRAEEAEIRHNDYGKALRLYQAALSEAAADTQAVLLLKIARTARKDGDMQTARQSWRRILSLPVSSATAPARLALVESGEGRALDFYRDLISGDFPFARESYLFYLDRVRRLIGDRAAAEFRDEEDRRTALTEAAEAFLAAPRRNPAPGFATFWDASRGTLIPMDVLLLRLTKAAKSVQTAVVSIRPRPSPAGAQSAARPLSDPDLPWQIEAAPLDAAAAERSLRNRQRLFLGAMALVSAVLLSGILLTARAFHREAAVSRLQTDFVATVSHEFRSPLTGIRQLAELLDSGIVQADDRRREYYRLILQESDRLAHLVENLLDFSRLEAGRKQYRMAAIDSSPWLEATAAIARNPRLSASIPPRLPTVQGDPEALASALLNLMDNALKYSPPRSPVRLAARAGSGRLSISVADRGPGIATEEHARIFERFYRGGGELSRQVKGAGIGLSIVKRIVEDHGGSVSVVSQPGEGSTFTIDLKVLEEHSG